MIQLTDVFFARFIYLGQQYLITISGWLYYPWSHKAAGTVLVIRKAANLQRRELIIHITFIAWNKSFIGYLHLHFESLFSRKEIIVVEIRMMRISATNNQSIVMFFFHNNGCQIRSWILSRPMSPTTLSLTILRWTFIKWQWYKLIKW